MFNARSWSIWPSIGLVNRFFFLSFSSRAFCRTFGVVCLACFGRAGTLGGGRASTGGGVFGLRHGVLVFFFLLDFDLANEF